MIGTDMGKIYHITLTESEKRLLLEMMEAAIRMHPLYYGKGKGIMLYDYIVSVI